MLAPRWGNSAVDLLCLPAVLAAASLFGLWPALLAGGASALTYNFFFTPPFHTFHMGQPADIVTVVVLLLVAAVTSRLAANVREQAEIATAHSSELAKRPGRVLTHSQILRTVWGPAQEQQTEYLRVTVRALRQKLEDRPAEPRLIINEPGVGYRLTG